MNHTTRHKISTGVGLLAMLLGGLFLLAPSAGADHVAGNPAIVEGNPSCVSLGYTTEVKFEPVAATGGPVSGISYTSSVDSQILHFDWTSTQYVIEAVIVKQGAGAGIFTTGGVKSGTAWVVPNNSDDQSTVSHLSFCHNGTTTTTEQETTTTTEQETTTTEQETTTTTEDIEVLEDVVENTTTTEIEVLQATDEALPMTGAGTNALAGAGVALLALGAGLALASRRLALTQG